MDVQNLHIEIKNTVKQMLNAGKQGGLYAEHHSWHRSCNFPQIAEFVAIFTKKYCALVKNSGPL